MKLATVDIGSNSVHLLIVEVDDEGHFRPMDKEREMVRLGSQGLTEGRLASDAMDRAIGALTHYASLARAHGCERIIATATSAVREADNGDKFLRRVLRKTGIEVDLLSGVEEARLIALAVNYVRDPGDARTLGIDIGGGSTEFWITQRGANRVLISNRLGSVRLTEGYLRDDPPSPIAVQRLRAAIASVLARTSREVGEVGFDRVVVTSGTALTLADMAAAREANGRDDESRPPLDTEGMDLTAGALKEIVAAVTTRSLKARKRLPGLPADRADIIVAGAVLLDTIYDELGISVARTCDWSLREGVLINYLQERFGALRPATTSTFGLSDIRRRSVLALARRCEYDAGHAAHTARLATSIFDQTANLHGLDRDARDLLEAAAVLHDIGYAISHNGHSEHAQYLIMNSEMLGFSSREQSIVGSVARYHQQSAPKKEHVEFGRLRANDRAIVRRLSAILRVADALDRSSRAAVADVDVRAGSKAVRFEIHPDPAKDCDLELWAARRKAGLFEKVFERKVAFRLAQEAAEHVAS